MRKSLNDDDDDDDGMTSVVTSESEAKRSDRFRLEGGGAYSGVGPSPRSDLSFSVLQLRRTLT